MICCVREVPWIIDSIERQAQRNPFELSGLFGYEAGGTVYTRVARVAGSEGMVGYALDALREACFGAHSDRLILLDYEALARAPGPSIKELYRQLGEPLFSHDFDAVFYEAEASRFGAGHAWPARGQRSRGVAPAPDGAAARSVPAVHGGLVLAQAAAADGPHPDDPLA